MRSGRLYARPMLALPIAASACSSWPTATGTDAKSSAQIAGQYANPKAGTTLCGAARNFPTPFGFQAGNGPDGNEFSTAIRRDWGTPRAPNHDGTGYAKNAAQARLEDQAAEFPTPKAIRAEWRTPTCGDVNHDRARASDYTARRIASGQTIALADQARDFPTPKASAGGPDSRATGKNLAGAVSSSFLPPETTPPDGLGSSPIGRTSGPWFSTPTAALGSGGNMPNEKRRKNGGDRNLNRDLQEMGNAPTAKLNPNFVDWLMGWPPGWSSARIGSASPETASFRSKLRSHLSALLDG